MDELTASFLQWGVQGAIIVVLGWYIIKKENQRIEADDRHRQEREVWRLQTKEQFEKLYEINQRSIEASEKASGLMNELKSIIQTIKR